MKLNICLALLLIPFWGNSQTKKSGFIFAENGVTRLKLSPSYLSSYVDYYKIPKDNFNMVQFPKNSYSSLYRNDTLVSENNFDNPIEINPIDFRNISIGFGKIINLKKGLRIDHAIGLQYSFADFSLGTFATDLIQKENTSVDAFGKVRTTFIESNNTLSGYGKIKSAGLTYQNTATLTALKRINISFAMRQNLLLKMEDKLMLLQTQTHDTLDYNPYYYPESCGGMGIGVLFNDINFYRKELPPSDNYKIYKGNMGLQYQMNLLVRISLNLGKKYGTKLYSQIGASPFSFYGKQFKVNSAINYGIGVLHDFNF
jgi:hypothetical protein